MSAKAKLRVELPFSIGLEAFSRIHFSSARGFPESSGGPELAGLRELEDRDVREILFGVSLERDLGSRGKLRLSMSRTSRREEIDSPGIDPEPGNPANPAVPPSMTRNEYERWDLGLSSSWLLPEIEVAGVDTQTKIVAGVDFISEDGESNASLDFGFIVPASFYETRETLGVFVEVEETIGSFALLSASVRFDSTPDGHDRVSPAAGMTIYLPDTPIELFGSYSEGFKRPSFYAIGNPLVGKPLLRAEQSRGWEVGLRGRAFDDRLTAQIS